jgi:predicted DNA-binding transcriptional regulator AlpA
MENSMDTLGVVEAAKYSNLSKSNMNKLRVYGGGPLYIKVGARVVYDRSDIDTWLTDKKVANTSQQVVVAS